MDVVVQGQVQVGWVVGNVFGVVGCIDVVVVVGGVVFV